ncbi:MAG: hypothetical protein ABMB14_32725 [Myxococcota bacterium]
MAQWLVMRGDTKFPVQGLAELESLARTGGIGSGDMIQPPGTTDWLYAADIPELKRILERSSYDDDDEPGSRSALGGAAMVAIAGVAVAALIGVILIGGGTMLYFATQIDATEGGLIGENGLSFSEMIVTSEGAGLRDDPADAARISTSVPKDSTLELLAKRGEFYRARSKAGAEGWIPASQVIPMYQLGGADVRAEYDPLYNPDRYVEVMNARWMQLPPEKGQVEASNITAFEFMMSNSSKYPMTDLKILATIKDTQGHEVERIEIPIEGMIPADGSTFVGTLSSEPADENGMKKHKKPKPGDPPPEPDHVMTTFSFEKVAADDPELQLRFTSGVEVEMKAEEFANAEIDILELRAVPDDEAKTIVRRD